jgi:hypothetical protein
VGELEFRTVRPIRRTTEPELRQLHRWLDSWRGIGDIAVGMHRQSWDLQLTAKASRPQSRRCLISVIASLRSDQPAAWGGKRFHE